MSDLKQLCIGMPICFEKMLSLQKRLWKQGVKKTDK